MTLWSMLGVSLAALIGGALLWWALRVLVQTLFGDEIAWMAAAEPPRAMPPLPPPSARHPHHHAWVTMAPGRVRCGLCGIETSHAMALSMRRATSARSGRGPADDTRH